MADYRESIEAIHKVYSTNGSRPVLITCNDLKEWVCKYDSINSLFNEFIASKFLQLWKIPTPPVSLVSILPAHIPQKIVGNRIQPRFFDKHCFGSLYLPYAKEVDSFLETFRGNYHELRKINARENLLKLGLFDLWISNEDQHQ